MERQPTDEVIFGGTEEHRENYVSEKEEAYNISKEELFGAENIVEPTLEEREAMQDALDYANMIAAHYGATRKVTIDRVTLLKKGGVQTWAEEDFSGVFNSYYQVIAVERGSSVLSMAKTLVHEALHMNSFHSTVFNNEEGKFHVRRSGISMHGRKGEGRYLEDVNESIVETLAQRYVEEVASKDPRYAKDLDNTSKLKRHLLALLEEREVEDNEGSRARRSFVDRLFILPDADIAFEKMKAADEEDEWRVFIEFYGVELLGSGEGGYSRGDEKAKFDNVLNEIISESQGRYNDKQKLFDMFARAHFTGNYLPLAREIEGVLGKGSFRRIAAELGVMADTTEDEEV